MQSSQPPSVMPVNIFDQGAVVLLVTRDLSYGYHLTRRHLECCSAAEEALHAVTAAAAGCPMQCGIVADVVQGQGAGAIADEGLNTLSMPAHVRQDRIGQPSGRT